MLKYRDGTIRKNVLKLARRPILRAQPRLQVLGLQVDDAAVMTRRGDGGRRFIGDGRKAAQIRFLRVAPARPKARDEHGLRRFGRKLQDHVSRLFPLPKRPVFHSVQPDILIEALDHHDGMVVTELFTPKSLQIIAPSVISEP